MLQLYTNIKNRRLALNMTQTELAKETGYSEKSVISRIEAGKVDLPQSKIVAFAAALQTTPGELMGDTPQEIETSAHKKWARETYGEIFDYIDRANEAQLEQIRQILPAIVPEK